VQFYRIGERMRPERRRCAAGGSARRRGVSRARAVARCATRMPRRLCAPLRRDVLRRMRCAALAACPLAYPDRMQDSNELLIPLLPPLLALLGTPPTQCARRCRCTTWLAAAGQLHAADSARSRS
jgi:hypothetical protein